jgi:hypothetical protein
MLALFNGWHGGEIVFFVSGCIVACLIALCTSSSMPRAQTVAVKIAFVAFIAAVVFGVASVLARVHNGEVSDAKEHVTDVFGQVKFTDVQTDNKTATFIYGNCRVELSFSEADKVVLFEVNEIARDDTDVTWSKNSSLLAQDVREFVQQRCT